MTTVTHTDGGLRGSRRARHLQWLSDSGSFAHVFDLFVDLCRDECLSCSKYMHDS